MYSCFFRILKLTIGKLKFMVKTEHLLKRNGKIFELVILSRFIKMNIFQLIFCFFPLAMKMGFVMLKQ